MAEIIKFKRLSKEYAERNYPKLAEAVDRIKGLSKEQEELMLGLGLEIALSSDGTAAVFNHDLEDELDFDTENDF